MWWRKKNRNAANVLLVALQEGAILKAHRTMDGEKVHKLHCQGREPTAVDNTIVRYLETHGLVCSNMKFPAATYLLTAQGVALAQELGQTTLMPVIVRTSVN